MGYPFEPFRYERFITEEHAYLTDNRGIIWIFASEPCCLLRPSLATCLAYVVSHDRNLDNLNSSQIFDKLRLFHPYPSWYDGIISIARKKINESRNKEQ